MSIDTETDTTLRPSPRADPVPSPRSTRDGATDQRDTSPPAGTPGGATGTDESTEGGAATGNWMIPLAVLIIGTFMSVLDTSITNVAIPKMQVDLSAAPDDVEWVVTGFTLALGVAVPVSGWLGERLGEARLYIMSLLGFAVASALCGIAWDLPSMLFFRVLQAVPGAILPVVTLTLLYQVVPSERIGSAMGIYGLGVVVAPAVGPVLGGYFVEYVNWRLIFFVNVPVGVIGAALAFYYLAKPKPTSWPKLDVWGFLSAGYGMFALLLACSEGKDWGWTGYRIMGLVVSGLLALALFVVIELEVDHPLIDLRIFASWVFGNAIALLGIVVTGFFSVLYFLPLYLQQVQGLQALAAGLVLVPSACMLIILMPVTGRLYDSIGPRWPAFFGLIIMGWACFAMGHMTPSTPRTDIIIWTCVRNLGLGLSMMPIFTTALSTVPEHLTSAASAMANVMQRVASSLAVAVFSSLGVTATAQLSTDRASLLKTGAAMPPELAQATQAAMSPTPDLTPMFGIGQALNSSVATQTYNNGYYLTGLLCMIGIPLTLFLPQGKQEGRSGAVEM